MRTTASRSARRRAALAVAAVLGIAVLCGAVRAATADLGPNDFAYGMPVVTQAESAAYRVTLPLDVYRAVARRDLGDIRVFNAQGQSVPFALHAAAATQTALTWHASTLYPLRPRTPVLIGGVRVSIDRAGAALSVDAPRQNSDEAHVAQYLIDVRDLDKPISALRLQWLADAMDYSGRLRVEGSEDLGAWQLLADAAPIANLRAAGQQLIENTVRLPGTRAKFLKLTWLGATPEFDLTAVSAGISDTPVRSAPPTLDLAGQAGVDAGEMEFDLRAHVPVESVNLLLPDVNTVVQVELASRDQPTAPWRVLARSGFYRLKNATGEQSSAAVDVPADTDRFWRVRVLAPMGAAVPVGARLQVSWSAREVAFLAREPAPFLLAYGSAVAPPAFSDLNILPESLQLEPATLGDVRVLGGATRLLAPPSHKRKPLILWSALVFGVALLALLAWRLSRESRRT